MADEKKSELERINDSKIENGYSVKEELCQEDNSPLRRQALMAFGTFMMTLGAGTTAGFSAILIPQLQDENRRHKFSTEMVSWVAATASLALFFGNLLSGYLMERLGRRRSQVILSVFFTSGWVIIGLSKNLNWILVGRFVTGLCQGWLGPLGPVFVGEISTPIYRGLFLASLSLAIAVGVFMSHLFGTFLHWSIASFLCGLFPLIGGIILFFAPETPAWLASQNRIDECVTSFRWYRGTSPAMKTELDKMIAEQSKKIHAESKLTTLKRNISKPEFWKPLIIMTMFFIITQLSGVNVICAYTTDLMKGLLGNNSHTYAAMLSIDVLRCVSLFGACVLLKRNGRRPMAMISGIFTSLSLIALAVYMYLVRGHISPWVSLGLMTVYMIVSNLGVVPLPWNMVGELFATETKGLGSGISVMMTSIAYFATIKTAPGMFHSIGHEGAYLFYGISTLLGTIYLYFYLPETRGKTLLEIEEHFRNSKLDKSKDVEKQKELSVPCV